MDPHVSALAVLGSRAPCGCGGVYTSAMWPKLCQLCGRLFSHTLSQSFSTAYIVLILFSWFHHVLLTGISRTSVKYSFNKLEVIVEIFTINCTGNYQKWFCISDDLMAHCNLRKSSYLWSDFWYLILDVLRYPLALHSRIIPDIAHWTIWDAWGSTLHNSPAGQISTYYSISPTLY